MGGRAGGGASGGMGSGSRSRQRPLAINDFEGMSKALAQHYAKMSDSERYKATQALANEIQRWADQERVGLSNTTTVSIYNGPDESLARFLTTVQKHGGFPADVATSVLKTVKYGPGFGRVAFMSSKQAWVLAKAGVEHSIPTYGSLHVSKSYSTKWKTKSGRYKNKTVWETKSIVPLQGEDD